MLSCLGYFLLQPIQLAPILITLSQLLNQLCKQGLDICGLTQLFMSLIIAHFQYALPAIVGQILVDDLNRIDAVFAKAFRWQLTSIVPSTADRVDNVDKILFHSALNPTHCLYSIVFAFFLLKP